MRMSVHSVYTDRPALNGLTHQMSHSFDIAHMGIMQLVYNGFHIYIHKKLLWTNKSELQRIE